MTLEEFKSIVQFLLDNGKEEHHGKFPITLAHVDWYGLKYGTDDRQFFPVKNINFEALYEKYKLSLL